MNTSVSDLPDPEALYQQLALDVKQFIASKNLQQPLIIGIRTGGAWLAQRLQKELALPELGLSLIPI